MKYDPKKHHRQSIRLKDYDYSKCEAYFVTICTHDRVSLLGNIVDGEMALNDAGKMIESAFFDLGHRFENTEIDTHVIMPNHCHGVIIVNDHDRRGESCIRPDLVHPVGEHKVRPYRDMDLRNDKNENQYRHPYGTIEGSLGRIIQAFKSLTTVEYIRGVKQQGWTSFAGKLWQRNYFERVIRDDEELATVREYIDNNPRNWEMDEENPSYSASSQQNHSPIPAERRR